MIKLDKTENAAFLEKSINYLEAKGYENIKADIEGYETPITYTSRTTDKKITPDIVAEKNGKRHYFDISLKSEKPTFLKSKWLFMESLSKSKSATFRIITTKGHYKFTDSMLADIHLENMSLLKIQ